MVSTPVSSPHISGLRLFVKARGKISVSKLLGTGLEEQIASNDLLWLFSSFFQSQGRVNTVHGTDVRVKREEEYGHLFIQRKTSKVVSGVLTQDPHSGWRSRMDIFLAGERPGWRVV